MTNTYFHTYSYAHTHTHKHAYMEIILIDLGFVLSSAHNCKKIF